jgi:hypothetical protein
MSHVTVETFCFHVSNVNKRVLKFACHGCLQYGNIICSVSDFADPTAGIASNVDQILAERDRLDDFYISMLLKSRSIPDTEWMNSRRLNIVYSHDKVQCFLYRETSMFVMICNQLGLADQMKTRQVFLTNIEDPHINR